MSLIHPSIDVKSIVEAALPRYFTYQRGKLGPARVFLTLMHMRIFGQRGYRRVLDELQGGLAHKLGWLWEDKPTSAALCKARRKLSIEQCETAFRAVYDHCLLAREHAEFTYCGRRVVSFDGTRPAGLTVNFWSMEMRVKPPVYRHPKGVRNGIEGQKDAGARNTRGAKDRRSGNASS